MHPADLEKLKDLRPKVAREARPQLEVRPLTKCPRDGTIFPMNEGVCPMCGDFA